MTTAQSTATITFALRTDAAAWIARNNGTVDQDGKVFVQVSADEVELVAFAGTRMLRHKFTDCPDDALNAAVACPATWVPDSAAFLEARKAA